MNGNYVRYEVQDKTAVIYIDNPPVNALKQAVLDELETCINKVDKDKTIRAVVITGRGKSFVAGADIKEFTKWTSKNAKELTVNGQKLFTRIKELRMPTIAAINGFALGGGLELTLVCDIRIASEKAKFGLPESSLGIIPAYGGATRLARTVGVGWAKRLIFSADMIDAQTALKIGLVQEVTAPEELKSRAMALAERISKNAPGAIRRVKKHINDSVDMEEKFCLKSEAEISLICFKGKEKKEGVSAFIEKRDPEF